MITGGKLPPLRIGPAIQCTDSAEARNRPITADGVGIAQAGRFILKNLVLLWRGLRQSRRGQHQRAEGESQDAVHVCAPFLDQLHDAANTPKRNAGSRRHAKAAGRNYTSKVRGLPYGHLFGMTACQPGKALPMPWSGFDRETKALMGLPKNRCLRMPPDGAVGGAILPSGNRLERRVPLA